MGWLARHRRRRPAPAPTRGRRSSHACVRSLLCTAAAVCAHAARSSAARLPAGACASLRCICAAPGAILARCVTSRTHTRLLRSALPATRIPSQSRMLRGATGRRCRGETCCRFTRGGGRSGSRDARSAADLDADADAASIVRRSQRAPGGPSPADRLGAERRVRSRRRCLAERAAGSSLSALLGPPSSRCHGCCCLSLRLCPRMQDGCMVCVTCASGSDTQIESSPSRTTSVATCSSVCAHATRFARRHALRALRRVIPVSGYGVAVGARHAPAVACGHVWRSALRRVRRKMRTPRMGARTETRRPQQRPGQHRKQYPSSTAAASVGATTA